MQPHSGVAAAFNLLYAAPFSNSIAMRICRGHVRRREAFAFFWSTFSKKAPRSERARSGRCSGGAFIVLLLIGLSAQAGEAYGQAVIPRLMPMPVAPLQAPSTGLSSVGADSLAAPTVLPELLPPPPWTFDVLGKLNASQAAYHNWTEGGLNTLAFTTVLNGQATRKSRNWKQTHTADFALGFIQQDTLTIRKADDRLRLSSSLQYRGNGFFRTFNPTIAASLRTQFLAGFNYDENPFPDERSLPVEVSDFLAPATLTQSVGLTYEPGPWLSQRLSLGAKEVLVTDRALRGLYGLPSSDGLRYEAGVESTTELDREFFEDVHVQSSLRLFAAFNREDVPDMLWENLVSLKFNEWLSLDFELATLYDGDVTQALQVREAISLGASIKML